MSRHRTRSFSNPILHKSNSNTTSSTTATKSLLNDPSSDVPASSTMAAAAAAAALRSRPPSFVSVVDVKTKRMLRRKSSASSHGDTGNTPRELQTIRKSSSGSMLQRSFCESSSKWPRMPINTPPVPPLPDKIPWKIPESRKESITSGVFYAQKISTQTLNPDNNKLMASAIRPKSSSHQKLSSSPSTGRMSINFSLPTEYRPNSPATQRKFISPLPADLTSIVSSSNSNSVNYANSRKLISGPESSVSMKVVDKSEESLAKKEGLAQSQARRATIATDKFQGNGSKNAKTTKNVMTRTKRSSTLSVKYPFMTKPSFFSSTNKTLPSNLENTDDQAQNSNNDNNNNNGFQYLKSLEFEKFPSSFSIDREQFNYFDLENNRQVPTNMQKIVDNQYSTDPFPQAKKNPLSPLLIHPAELSNGHALDSIISISDLSLENKNQSEHNHASQISDGGNSVDSNQNSDEIMQKYSPIIPTSHFFMKPKCSAAINYLTHSTNHPCKSVLKCTAPSLTFGGSEDFNKVSKDESHSKRTVSRAGLERNPSIVDRKSSAAFNLSSVTETQKVRDRSNPDPEKTKDVSFSMKINEIIKPRPRLPSFGSMLSKKKLEEVEEHRLVKPLESINYTLSPLSPVSPITINTYPSLKMPETDKNKKSNNLIISNQVKNENWDNAANIQNSKNQLHNYIESTKDYSQPSKYFSGTIETLQNIKSNENLTTLTSEQMSENSNLESKSTVNTPESHLTFLESPTSSTYSQSSSILRTPQTTTITMKFERLHVPGAWDSLNEDLNISQKSDIKLGAETLQLSCNVENQSSINDITNNYTQKANIDNSQVLSICEKDSISHKTPENSKIEEDSEAGSIYCDAIENIVIAENSDYSCNNAIFSNSAVYEEGEDDGRIQATTENSTDQLHFALPMKSVASQGEKLTNSIVGRLPHRQISDRLTIQPLRNTENNRSFLSSPKFSSEPAAREKYTRSVPQEELHASQEVKVSLPSISIRRKKSRESVSSFKRAQPIVRELHLRNSMREPIKPKANKFRVSDLSSSRYENSSYSLTQTCNLRTASKYYFSKIRKRHTLGLPIDEKIITKNANCLFDSNESQDFTHPTRKIRLINSSNDDTTNNPKFQNNEVSRLPPEIPSFQARLDDYLDIRSDNYDQFNELPDPSNSFESNKTAGPVSLITKEQNKTTFSTPNFNNQIPIKPKENLISMIRRMKADVNYKVRRQEKEEIMAANTIQDLQDHKSYTLKNQDNSFNFPNYDSEQSPSWPLPTSKNINTEITNIKSPELCIDQKTIVVTDSSPIKRFFGHSDMPSRVSNSTRPDSSHQKKHGSLKRILRRDG
ncbi:hypothetical protein OnM2_023061 [Erysiphe neolycopersici]|uniref:Uncharacterized protein n=1 Tax=Erysiphe neolycopersici TaxID=212602 RepID=A0A420I290_9PEZI|nr:hypothetical protein OnM2_023061 [Erysiphe neolycopersici]